MYDEFKFDASLSRSAKDKPGLRAAAERLPSVVAEAGQIFRKYAIPDRGLDAEIEFHDGNGQPKTLDTYYYQRRADGAEVFTIRNERHPLHWLEQPFPVMLPAGAADGSVRWMDVRDYLKKQKAQGLKFKEIIFKGEPVTAAGLRLMREQVMANQSANYSTADLRKWAGGSRIATLAIVFSDIVGSTALGEKLGDAEWNELRRQFMKRSRDVLRQQEGFLIKTMGDGIMVVFHNAAAALDFAADLRRDGGDAALRLRQVGHVGLVTLDGDDIFGRHVNLAARVQGRAAPGDIIVTEQFKKDIDCIRDPRHKAFVWEAIRDVSFKGFAESFNLWIMRAE